MSHDFKNNSAQSRFECHVGQHIAFANYRLKDDTLYIDYVEAPAALRGTGAAGKLMEHITQEARQRHLKVIPVCSYAAAWLRKHRDHGDIE